MTNAPKHIILEQLIELELEREEEAPRYQQELSRIVRQRLLPIFDKVCAGTDPDTIYRIDTLELDLGELNPSQWEKQLTERVQAQFSQKLQEAVQQLQQSGSPEKQPASGPLELLRLFLYNATLPWWADTHDLGTLKDSVEQLLRQQPTALFGLLQETIGRETNLHRLIYGLPDQLLAQLAALSAGRSGKDFLAIPALQTSERIPPNIVRREIWKAVFYGFLQSSGSYNSAEQLASFMQMYLQETLRMKVNDRMNETIADVIKGVMSESPSIIKPGELVPLASKVSEIHHSDELHLSNAGLVLLWPFLIRFFENLGLVKDKAFVDERATHQAIALLQFLADGNMASPEYLLPLNKVLCGLRPDALYEPQDETISEDEQQAALQFLEAVIANAPILHNMSVDGFRNTFLRRAAILSVEDDHWLLQVERETYDVVLERFPWTYQIVKLPWMERPMYVNW